MSDNGTAGSSNDENNDRVWLLAEVEKGVQIAEEILMGLHSSQNLAAKMESLSVALYYYHSEISNILDAKNKSHDDEDWFFKVLVHLVEAHEKSNYEKFVTAYREAGNQGGYNDTKTNGQAPYQYCKQQYKQAKKQDGKRQPVCHCCGKEAPSGTKLMKCSQCLVTFYCGKECQVADWKNGHKKVCKALKAQRTEDSLSAADKAMNGAGLPRIPWIGIALPESLTGLPGEVLCHVTPWAFDEMEGFKKSGELHHTEGFEQSVRYFFKTYQTSAEAASELYMRDVGNMGTDVLALFWMGYPGVRQISVSEGMECSLGDGSKFCQQFRILAPIPDDWKVDPKQLEHLPPGTRVWMEHEIEKLRNDPRYQGED